MHSTLWFLGVMCAVAAGGCVVLALLGTPGLLPLAPGFAFVGIVFLSLAAILDRVTRIESLLKSRTDRIMTDVGDFERLGNIEGEAMCIGCRRTVPKAGLYYNKSLDVYYHPECLSRDRSM